jgi:enoyl-CoA hydratase
VITTQRTEPIAVVTIDRPEARNALTGQMMADLVSTMVALDEDPAIRVIVLTGTDPAFCAGLDLKDLARTYDEATSKRPSTGREIRSLLPILDTPLIGAINGPAVTGGLELAMGCDFLIASHRASFADTHARVGVMPGGGMSIRLPQLVGINRARQMSLTGNFVDAGTACEWGLVNEVVMHSALMDRTLELARSIAEAPPESIRELRRMYAALAHRSDPEVYREESAWSRRWMNEKFNASQFEKSRDTIIERGSSQQQ